MCGHLFFTLSPEQFASLQSSGESGLWPRRWAGSRQQNSSVRKMRALPSEMAVQVEREQHRGTCEQEEGA